MSELCVGDFDAYFQAVHGCSPFPWQRRLLEQVASEGIWPRLLDLPTGVGKTAALDVAVFHRALDTAGVERRAPTRVVVVVDRRTIVDQTFERARRIRNRLTDQQRPAVLTEVATRLRAASVDGQTAELLHVATLRGGMVRETAWARRPDQPTILVSTVDQVGSRLLFRGYGVSSSMRPIHAGLLGSDTLFLLDEVHLSEPFRQTLASLSDRYRTWAEQPLPRRWQVVEMSATPSSAAPTVFRLGNDDREHEILSRRLRASKPVRLADPVKVSGPEEARVRKFSDAVAAAALIDGAPIPGKSVGVVVNRVGTARAVFDQLVRRCGPRARVLLLTGRMRPADRVEAQDEILRYVGAGRPDRSLGSSTTIVIATQCIEAGADLDFDVLVTECASWDALKQRFGRLNRLGDSPDCRGTILIRSDQMEAPDAVYGQALATTWAWLRNKGEEIDVGLSGTFAAELCPRECLPPACESPLMLPAHLDAWVQTSPTPEPDPEVALWLHGLQRERAEIQFVWRADVRPEELVRTDDTCLEVLKARLSLCPPSAGEALSVPLHAARAWLKRQSMRASDIPDVPFAPTDDGEDSDEGFRPALRWRGEDSDILKDTAQLEPGDTLIVPSTYGGLTSSNWDPASDSEVRDLANRVTMTDRKIPILRLLPAVLKDDFGELPFPEPPLEELGDDADEDEDVTFDRWLTLATDSLSRSTTTSNWLSQTLTALRKSSNRRVIWIGNTTPNKGASPTQGYYTLIGRRYANATTEDDGSSFTGVAVRLEAHLRGVAAWARAFADGCGLRADLVAAVEAAGRWHDIGKADPRFQLRLHGGDWLAHSVAPYLLAKSAAPVGDLRLRQRITRRSGYPKGARHELMSLALMASAPDRTSVPSGVDRDLVLHLVASHHGYCRPFAPVVLDPEPRVVQYEGPEGVLRETSDHQLARLDSGVSERFFKLNRRYGWFGLAWMEAILRLADHRRSEAEQKQGDGT